MTFAPCDDFWTARHEDISECLESLRPYHGTVLLPCCIRRVICICGEVYASHGKGYKCPFEPGLFRSIKPILQLYIEFMRNGQDP